MLTEIKKKSFANGIVYALKTHDGFPVETTDTHLPLSTLYAAQRGINTPEECNYGSRRDRWMIGVSCMSGCPVGCKFCATGQLRKWRPLTSDEIVAQVEFILNNNPGLAPTKSHEFKINYTRMGEPFLNLDAVREAIDRIELLRPGTHHYVSTIGVKGSDFSWIEGNITLQLSLHSLNSARRDWLIPWKRKMSIDDLGRIRTRSRLKTTLNLTLCDRKDFDINSLLDSFSQKFFFIKLSPINPNPVSDSEGLGTGVIEVNR